VALKAHFFEPDDLAPSLSPAAAAGANLPLPGNLGTIWLPQVVPKQHPSGSEYSATSAYCHVSVHGVGKISLATFP